MVVMRGTVVTAAARRGARGDRAAGDWPATAAGRAAAVDAASTTAVPEMRSI